MNPLIVIGALVALSIFLKAQAVRKLVFYPGGVRISKGKLVFNLQIVNPTDQTLSFNSIAGEVSYNGKPVSVLKYFGKLDVKPNSEVVLPISLSLNAAGVLSTIITALTSSPAKDKLINIDATINAGGINYPFNEEFKFSV